MSSSKPNTEIGTCRRSMLMAASDPVCTATLVWRSRSLNEVIALPGGTARITPLR